MYVSLYVRLGSGSASRSIYGGFVKWNRGEEASGSDSCAEQVKLDQISATGILCLDV